ncbi:MAG: hypothetical protein FJ398_20985 [Verrucomicrobia bacterium]|nr:hypothetical protein [Verrucomicrobiota bacterium]
MAFRPLQRRTPERGRKQPEGCGPRSLRFEDGKHGPETKEAFHEPFLRTAAFRPLQRWTPESARKQPAGCGPRSLRFMGHVHGSEAKEASHGLTPSPFALPTR